jgi:polar amino acid transport system substrate-binding protein
MKTMNRIHLLAGCALLLLATGPTTAAAPLVITTEHSPPASMMVDGTMAGHETDKIREMMARTGTSYRIEQLPWKRAYTMALAPSHTCVYPAARTPEREKLFKWVGPTDEAEWVLWGRADHAFPLNSLEDARQLRIGTYLGDVRDDYLRSRGFRVEAVPNDLLNPQKLMLNRFDLWALGVSTAPRQKQEWSGQIVPLLVFNRIKIHLACNPAVPDELIRRLNAALDDMRRDGTVARLDRKYENWAPPR